MEWTDVLRLVTVIAMAWGAWQSWKALPKPTIIDGRKCYRQPDGSYRTLWGRRVAVPEGVKAKDQEAGKQG